MARLKKKSPSALFPLPVHAQLPMDRRASPNARPYNAPTDSMGIEQFNL